MKELATILSEDIPELRVDFYEVNNKIYFGELTFFDGSGFERIGFRERDEKIRGWITLQKKRELK